MKSIIPFFALALTSLFFSACKKDNDAVEGHQTSFLNSMSLLDSTVQVNDTNDSTSGKYVYNSAKQLIELKRYFENELSTTTYYTYDSNGNFILEDDSHSSYIYAYASVFLNPALITPPFLPIPKQLPTNTVYTLSNTSYTITHEYIYDADQRLTSGKSGSSNGEIVIKSYTY